MCIKCKDLEIIKYVLSQKIDPDETTLKALVESCKRKKIGNNMVRYRRNRKIRRNERIIKKKKVTVPKVMVILNMLMGHGLKINLNCIGMLLSLNLYLPNLETYNIPYDEDLYFMCYVNEYFPDEYMSKFTIDKNILIMRDFVKNKLNTYTKFTKFIKDNNIVLDNYMLDKVFLMRYQLRKLHDTIFIYNNCIPSPITMYKKICNKVPKEFIMKFDKKIMLVNHNVKF
jgi:hypothetical protein